MIHVKRLMNEGNVTFVRHLMAVGNSSKRHLKNGNPTNTALETS